MDLAAHTTPVDPGAAARSVGAMANQRGVLERPKRLERVHEEHGLEQVGLALAVGPDEHVEVRVGRDLYRCEVAEVPQQQRLNQQGLRGASA